MVGPDDAGPGDDEDVPAWLERGRHHPERLSESAADPVPNDRTSQLASGRDPEASRREVGPQEPGGEQGVGPGRSLLLDRREVLRSREHHESRRRVPRSVVRPSAASDPELAVQPGSGVPRSSSCGRESRAPWHDGASWAGTSASSGRSCDPLDPTSGTVAPSSPRGTQTRPVPRGAHGASSSGG